MEIDHNKLINELLEFFKANLYFKHHVKTSLEFAKELPLISAIYSDFYQAIGNIIQNSIDALYKQEKKEILIQTKLKNDEILLIISDTGIGIPEDKIELIFEPFFSTKPGEYSRSNDDKLPKGNGLGLTMSYYIFKKYNVGISFQSETGKGTRCTIKIPKELILN